MSENVWIHININRGKPVLNGNWAERKPVFSGKLFQSRGSTVSRIQPSSTRIKQNLPATVPCDSVIGRFHCILQFWLKVQMLYISSYFCSHKIYALQKSWGIQELYIDIYLYFVTNRMYHNSSTCVRVGRRSSILKF